MDPKPTYRIPEYISRELAGDKPLSENDVLEISRILASAESFSYPPSNTEMAWKTFSARIQPVMKVEKTTARFAMFRWVAAAVVVLTFGIGLWQYLGNQTPAFTAVYQSEAEKSSYSLPDGSRVQLNSGSVLEVKAIDKNNRILELKSGEVFLQVAHNEVPFKVITDKGIITVKGTEFNIRNIINRPFALFLKSGSIEFKTANQTITMLAGDNLEENKDGDLVLSKVRDNRSYAWTTGKLSFDNALVSDVIKGLEDLYKVSFIYDEKLSNEKLTITFDNLSVQHAAELLSKTLNSQVQVK